MSRIRIRLIVAFVALAAAAVWLRAPSFSHEVWNVDEAIHAAVAHELLHGGVLYRDAIDQRTPLTYYVVAAVFGIFGMNNLWALHLFTALLIAATGFGLWRAGAAWRQPTAGAWAGALYVIGSVVLFYQGDAFAFNTEWFVAFFTTGAAWCLAHHVGTKRDRWLVATGAALGGAFLSKQPALLDAIAPVATLAYLAWRQPENRRPLVLRGLTLVAGWLAPVSVVAIYFALRGAWTDAVFYAWTYNVQVYGPEISTIERLASGWKLVAMVLDYAPVLLPWTALALLSAAFLTVQRNAGPQESSENGFLFFALVWSATSFAGAMSGGRGFDHYFIQTLPALTLLTSWLLARVGRLAGGTHHRPLARIAALTALGGTVLSLGQAALVQRTRTLPPDTSQRAAEFVRRATVPEERVFIWGYHPDFLLFAERRTASRFVYSSFLTGLVPWSNTSPEITTDYAIVPGAMDTLLAELESRRPAFFVDCSAGPNRHWQKYPLAKFPRLRAFVDRHYVLADPEQFRPQGYDLYLIRAESRRSVPATPAKAPAQLATPTWFGQARVPNQPGHVTIAGSCTAHQLTRLELIIAGRSFGDVAFAPVDGMKLRIPVPFHELGLGRHKITVRATAADGSTRMSPPAEIEVLTSYLPESELDPFSLPQVTALLRPLFVQTLFGASAEFANGRSTFYAHAPSTIAFPIASGTHAVSGGFGIRDGAWDATAHTQTDGAEFRVELVTALGDRRVLLRRLLQPSTHAVDRGVQPFHLFLPRDIEPRSQLEFVITAGAHDNPAADWTFWTDLRLESSR